jgi:hypothetical protein
MNIPQRGHANEQRQVTRAFALLLPKFACHAVRKQASEFEIMLIAEFVARQIISKISTPFVHSILTRLECNIPTQSSKISLTRMPA